jgi:hypothetical protein
MPSLLLSTGARSSISNKNADSPRIFPAILSQTPFTFFIGTSVEIAAADSWRTRIKRTIFELDLRAIPLSLLSLSTSRPPLQVWANHCTRRLQPGELLFGTTGPTAAVSRCLRTHRSKRPDSERPPHARPNTGGVQPFGPRLPRRRGRSHGLVCGARGIGPRVAFRDHVPGKLPLQRQGWQFFF